MKIIGLTGGSGAGKGEVCKAFLSLGIESVDTDKISREVTKKGGGCLNELVGNFSGAILTSYGELDRKKLADIAFDPGSNGKNLETLNKITHKHILNECKRIILDMQNAGRKALIIDAPLLFESGFDKSCDVIIAVVADLDKRTERIIKRDSITGDQAAARIKNQKSDRFFLDNSDHVIYNNSDYADIYIQVSKIYDIIFK
jgi:dephospho-CoA kinase